MGFLDDIKNRILIFDGSKGFMLQQAGLPAGESPETFNLSYPEIVYKLHKAYIDAGCDVIQTNTFTGNRVLLEKHGLGESVYEINRSGAAIAKRAANGNAYVAASIGPTGLLFEPFGKLTFEMAYDVFKEQIQAVADGGADIVNFETFTDIAEMKAALLAAKENTSLPVICSMAFEKNHRTLMGTEPEACARILKAAGADMVGANCSFGPAHMIEIIKAMAVTGEFLSVKPNAGLPRIENGETVYDQCSVDFAEDITDYFQLNVRLIGGCCGTTPAFISEIIKKSELKKYEGKVDNREYLCSSRESVLVEKIINIGKLLLTDDMDKEEITENLYELAYDDSDAIEIEYMGTDMGTIENILLENINLLKKTIIISGNNELAITKALRIYPGLAGIRKKLSKNYGAIVI